MRLLMLNKVRRQVDDSVAGLGSSLGLGANGCFHLSMRPQLHILLRQHQRHRRKSNGSMLPTCWVPLISAP